MVAVSPIRMIVGLGNPGPEYAATRHNAGFQAVDRLMQSIPGTSESKRACSGQLAIGRFRGNPLLFLKPMTYMNLSGESVRQAEQLFKISPSEILVIYDDLDIPVGQLRLRGSGSAGGHNGMSSVIEHLNTQSVPRLRIGIGKEGARNRQVDYVLSDFTAEDKAAYEQSLDDAVDLVKFALARGISHAMARYNQKVTERKAASAQAEEPVVTEPSNASNNPFIGGTNIE